MSIPYRFTRLPRSVRRAHADNLALVSGESLPFIERCQEIANRLPQNGVLIVVPQRPSVQKETMLSVARQLAKAGHQVRVMPAAEVQHRTLYESRNR